MVCFRKILGSCKWVNFLEDVMDSTSKLWIYLVFFKGCFKGGVESLLCIVKYRGSILEKVVVVFGWMITVGWVFCRGYLSNFMFEFVYW